MTARGRHVGTVARTARATTGARNAADAVRRAGRTAASGLAVLALGAAAVLFTAAPVLAAPTWLAPAKLSAPGQSAEQPQVSSDASGDAVAVWERNHVIEVAGRPAGSGAWQPAVAISNKAEAAEAPEVALDAQGDVVAAWLSSNGTNESIQISTRTGLSGAWQAPVTLKQLGALTPAGPDLAVDQAGGAVVAWRDGELIEASSRPAGGTFQTPETLSKQAEQMAGPEVGIDAAGDATADWEENPAGGIVIDASRRLAGGKWQSPVAISQPNGVNEPRLAVDARGDAVAVWEHFFEESGAGKMEEHIEAATMPAGSPTWGSPVSLTKTEAGIGEPGNQQVAVDGQGDAIAIWGRMHGVHETIESSQDRASSASWSAPIVVSGPGATTEEAPQVGVDERGDALIVWERSNGVNPIVEATSGSAVTVAWQTPVSVSAPGKEAKEPQVALDAQGNAAAVFSRFDGAFFIAEAAGFDAAGPLLNALTIPTAGAVGQPLAFSVSPLDVFSALGATSWSFGDGTSQAGPSVSHVYGASGTYTVAVTSADVLGNVSSASAALSITPVSAGTKAPIVVSRPSSGSLVAPKITGARLSSSRFRVSRRATAISAKAKPPQGTTFHFTLTEAAKLQIAFTRSAAGLRGGRRCLTPSARLRRAHAKRCTRTVTVGTLTRAREQAGADSLAFSGRIGSRPLAPGAYRAILAASAGGFRSASTTLSLTVVR
jgi:hypothetical protein